MNAGTLLIRADASTEIGIGHVMRCLALAQAWQDVGGDVVVCQAQSVRPLDEILTSAGISLVALDVSSGTLLDAVQTREIARIRNAQWVVIDGYHFDAEYQKLLKDGGLKILFIDDSGCCAKACADLILNSNMDADDGLYPQYQSDQLLLGPAYILLRREFLNAKNQNRNTDSAAHKIVVTMGGSDPLNITETVVHALHFISDLKLEVIVVVGAGNPHINSLLRMKSQHPSLNFEIRRNISEMAILMACADSAISAGGGTAYELIFSQIPMILITTADNQENVCRSLGDLNVAINAGWFHDLDIQRLAKQIRALIVDSKLRRTLIQNCRHLIDGKGARRVARRMLSSSGTGVPKEVAKKRNYVQSMCR